MKPKTKWKPEIGKKYWFLAYPYIEDCQYDNNKIGKLYTKNNLIFRTKKEAENVRKKLLKYAKGLK